MFGNLDNTEIESVLYNQIVGRVGCHAEGITYVVPISYAYDGTSVYAHSKDGMKIKFMRINPAICFQVDEMKDMANWKSVLAWGQFEELSEKADRDKALQVLTDRTLPLVSSETTHLSPIWPFRAGDSSEIPGILFRIRLTEKTGRFENNFISVYR